MFQCTWNFVQLRKILSLAEIQPLSLGFLRQLSFTSPITTIITSTTNIWILLGFLNSAHIGQAAMVLGWRLSLGDNQCNWNGSAGAWRLRCQAWAYAADSTVMIDPINTPRGISFSQASLGIIASSVTTMPKCIFCIFTKLSVLIICYLFLDPQLSLECD